MCTLENDIVNLVWVDASHCSCNSRKLPKSDGFHKYLVFIKLFTHIGLLWNFHFFSNENLCYSTFRNVHEEKKVMTIELLPKWQLWKFGIGTDGLSDLGIDALTFWKWLWLRWTSTATEKAKPLTKEPLAEVNGSERVD